MLSGERILSKDGAASDFAEGFPNKLLLVVFSL